MKDPFSDKSWPFIDSLLKAFPQAEVFLVGGSVRDALLGRPQKDDDFVVRGIELEQLSAALSEFGKVNLVGKRFGVIKFRPHDSQTTYDIALPRTESSRSFSGAYRDFDIQSDPHLPIEQDLARRDFTINAMAFDLRTKQLVDPFLGRKDLEDKAIRAVGSPALRFQEDYSRMLRAIRFASQLGFALSEKTSLAVRKLAPHLNDRIDNEWVVSREIIGQEFLKSFDASPLNALRLLDEYQILAIILPELKALQTTEQTPPYHHEGTAYDHVMLALKATESPEYQMHFPKPLPLLSKLGILFHDIAKPLTPSVDKKGQIHFYGHQHKGAELTAAICRRLHFPASLYAIDCGDLAWIVKHHLFAISDFHQPAPLTTLEELFFSKRPGESLQHVILADLMASKADKGIKRVELFTRLKQRLNGLAPDGVLPDPFLSGDDVIELLHIKPGPKIKEILLDLRERQLKREIKTKQEAIDYLNASK